MIKIWDKTPLFNEEYGQPEPNLKPFLLENKKKTGAVIVCPGGGYRHLAPHEADPVAKWVNSTGLSAFVLTYRVEPYTYKATISDVLRAVQYVRYNAEKFGIDPERIAVLGFSAGGHLASSAAVHFDDFEIAGEKDEISKTSARPDAAVLCYPVISADKEIAHLPSFERLLGEDCENENVRNFFSNEKQIKPDTPPTFLWHTAADATVNVINSLVFAKGLKDKDIPFELHIFPNGRHGLSLGDTGEVERISEWTKSCENWFKTINFI